ncbi:MAG: hypothetical protein QME58_08430 [Bacteroidota bacterium]|nr:hypothetical protein [Bacteroidota bacterium]
MGYGIPVIASNIREIRDIVIDKELLFEVGDSESLCKILTLILQNIETHRKYSEGKKAEVLAKYSWDSTAKVLEGLIRKLVNG